MPLNSHQDPPEPPVGPHMDFGMAVMRLMSTQTMPNKSMSAIDVSTNLPPWSGLTCLLRPALMAKNHTWPETSMDWTRWSKASRLYRLRSVRKLQWPNASQCTMQSPAATNPVFIGEFARQLCQLMGLGCNKKPNRKAKETTNVTVADHDPALDACVWPSASQLLTGLVHDNCLPSGFPLAR